MIGDECGEKLRGMFMGNCTRPATVERDGKHYCWQHDPKRHMDERAKRWQIRKAELLERERKLEAKFARLDLEREAGVNDLSDDTLRDIVALGGIQAMIGKLKGA